MKRIEHTSGREVLIGILLSVSIGLVLILISPGRTKAHSTKATPCVSFTSSRIRVQQIYTSQIGVREKQINSGPEVGKYLRYVHLAKGNPWCAAFVCWVLGEAGVEDPRTGWSPGLFPDERVIWKKGARSYPLLHTSYLLLHTSYLIPQASGFPLLSCLNKATSLVSTFRKKGGSLMSVSLINGMERG